MNIESVNLSSLVPSTSTIENMPPPPLTDGGVAPEGFSGTLTAQLGLLNTIKTGGQSPLPATDISGFQAAAGLPASKPELQNFAASLGNDLPPAPTLDNDVNHEAVLGAITDTLKYITQGTTAGEKAVAAEQNMKDVIAMAASSQQNMKDAASLAALVRPNTANVDLEAVLPRQNMKDVAVTEALPRQNMKDTVVVADPARTNVANVDVAAMAASSRQGMNGAAAMAASPRQGMNDAAAMEASPRQGMDGTVVVAAPAPATLNTETDVPSRQNLEEPTARAIPTKLIMENPSPSPVNARQTMSDVGAAGVFIRQNPVDAAKLAAPTARQMIEDVVVGAILAGQDMKNISGAATPIRQNIKDADVPANLAGQETADVGVLVIPTRLNKEEEAVATFSAGQNTKAIGAGSDSPALQNMKAVNVAAMSAGQNRPDAKVLPVPSKQNMDDAVEAIQPVLQKVGDMGAIIVPAKQNTKDAGATAGQSVDDAAATVVPAQQYMNDVGAMVVSAQMNLNQANAKPDKKQNEDETSMAAAEDSPGASQPMAAVVLPAVMPAEQLKAVNNLAPANAIEEDGQLSFSRPPIGDAKSDLPLKAANFTQPSETVFRQPIQDKQGFNFKSVESAVASQKTGPVGQQVASLDGEKGLPRVGADIAPLSRPVVDNKADVPAITKPLSHPEWNKDLGDRIVWMSNKAIPSAEIRLNPQHLGPISVRVNVVDDQASIVFTAQHAATREAIEASIPKLREMMGNQQLNLADVNVSQNPASDNGRSQAQNFAQTAEGRRQGAAGFGAGVAGGGELDQDIESGKAVASNGLLSIYA